MSTLPTNDARVFVYPFTRQPQGDEVVIGRPELGVFLAVPAEAVDLLDLLLAGKTVGEAQDHHQRCYGEVPDLSDFLGFLEKKGFVRLGQQPVLASGKNLPSPAAEALGGPRYHFESVPQALAQRLFSGPVLAGAGLFISLAIIAAALDPDIIPVPQALFFHEHRFLYAISLMIVGSSAVFLHEMGHLLAARAMGVNSRLNLSHRLWVIVAESDLTGLWAVPKDKRYLPMLAGPLVDLVSSSLLLLILFAQKGGWIHLGPVSGRLIPAVLFGYLMRITWQFFFFVRTDFYYIIANFFNCKSLLKDTESFLRNKLARIFPRVTRVDQSAIPPAELRVIRAYSIVWLAGRGVAFGVLFIVSLPLMFKYAVSIHSDILGGLGDNTYKFIDSLAFTILSMTPMVVGLTWWARSIVQGWRNRHERSMVTG